MLGNLRETIWSGPIIFVPHYVMLIIVWTFIWRLFGGRDLLLNQSSR